MVEEGAGRSAQKRRAILEAARTVFLRHGFGGATMDEVAALAAVSKQTVYKHFTDKQRLFSEVIAGDISEAAGRSQALLRALPDTRSLEVDLCLYAREHITTVLQPHLLQLRRVIIGEADRFPDLASAWYKQAPERAATTLAALFAKLAYRGLLSMDDPILAAHHFNWLILSIPLNKAMFLGSAVEFSQDELHRYADEGVRVFLAAYGRDHEAHD